MNTADFSAAVDWCKKTAWLLHAMAENERTEGLTPSEKREQKRFKKMLKTMTGVIRKAMAEWEPETETAN